MVSDQEKTHSRSSGGAGEKLPYRVELWDAQAQQVERVLARAVSAGLARAIFAAAAREHSGRHVALYRGARLIAETKKGGE